MNTHNARNSKKNALCSLCSFSHSDSPDPYGKDESLNLRFRSAF